MVSDFTPFFREIGVVMDFLANSSSLQLRHKLVFNDTLYKILTAKTEVDSRKNSSFGHRSGILIKMVVGFVWALLAIIILFGPLLPFTSIFNKSEPQYIKDAQMQVVFADSTGKDIGRLFETQTNIQTHEESIITPYYLTFLNKKANTIRTYDKNEFELMRMSKQSETRSTLEDRFFSLLETSTQDDIYKVIIRGSVIFRLQIQVGLC